MSLAAAMVDDGETSYMNLTRRDIKIFDRLEVEVTAERDQCVEELLEFREMMKLPDSEGNIVALEAFKRRIAKTTAERKDNPETLGTIGFGIAQKIAAMTKRIQAVPKKTESTQQKGNGARPRGKDEKSPEPKAATPTQSGNGGGGKGQPKNPQTERRGKDQDRQRDQERDTRHKRYSDLWKREIIARGLEESSLGTLREKFFGIVLGDKENPLDDKTSTLVAKAILTGFEEGERVSMKNNLAQQGRTISDMKGILAQNQESMSSLLSEFNNFTKASIGDIDEMSKFREEMSSAQNNLHIDIRELVSQGRRGSTTEGDLEGVATDSFRAGLTMSQLKATGYKIKAKDAIRQWVKLPGPSMNAGTLIAMVKRANPLDEP